METLNATKGTLASQCTPVYVADPFVKVIFWYFYEQCTRPIRKWSRFPEFHAQLRATTTEHPAGNTLSTPAGALRNQSGRKASRSKQGRGAVRLELLFLRVLSECVSILPSIVWPIKVPDVFICYFVEGSQIPIASWKFNVSLKSQSRSRVPMEASVSNCLRSVSLRSSEPSSLATWLARSFSFRSTPFSPISCGTCVRPRQISRIRPSCVPICVAISALAVRAFPTGGKKSTRAPSSPNDPVQFRLDSREFVFFFFLFQDDFTQSMRIHFNVTYTLT